MMSLMCISSGVVGNFLLWERLRGIIVTLSYVIGGRGCPNEWLFIIGKNPCLNMGLKF